MKKLLLFGSTLLITGVSMSARAGSQQADNTDLGTQGVTAWELPPSIVDEIEIPYEVLMYVQMKYQAHAVTHASRVIRNGQTIYRLVVDRDDVDYNNEVFYLLYNSEWDLIGEEKGFPEQADVAQPVKEKKDKKENHEGRGGGFLEEGEERGPEEDNNDEEEPEEPPAEEPEEPPVEEPPAEEPTP